MSRLIRTVLRTFLLAAIVCYAQEPNFATKVGADTTHVENAADALGAPDGKLALIRYSGVLELEVNATNGPGVDLAIYGKRAVTADLPETLNCAVFAKTDKGEWQYLGLLTGKENFETYDLGELKSTPAIKIVFRNPWDIQEAKPLNIDTGADLMIGVDAVVVLH